MDNTIKQITEELGANNVSDIVYDETKEKWVITYKNDLTPDEFEFFDQVYKFIKIDTAG